MKKRLFIVAAVGLLSLVGCKPTALMYQVSTITPVTDCRQVGTKLAFENGNAICWYDFWSAGGNTSVEFQNKTDYGMIVVLPQCSYTINGTSFPFYDQTREETALKKAGLELEKSGGDEAKAMMPASIQMRDTILDTIDPKLLYVAPNSTISIPGFVVNNLYLDDSGLLAKPKELQGKSLTYAKQESPFLFSNSFAYFFEGDHVLQHFNQDFYVSQISNIKAEELYEKYNPVNENGMSDTSQTLYYCPWASPNRYFVPYNPDDMPHNYSALGALYLGGIFLLMSLLLVGLNQ